MSRSPALVLATSLPGFDYPASDLALRFTLSYRGVEDLLAERGLDLSYETA